MKPVYKFSIPTLILCLMLTGCAKSAVDDLPRPRGSAPVVIAPESEIYASEEMSEIQKTGDSTAPESAASAAQTNIFEGKKPTKADLTKDLCDRVVKNAIEFSKLAAQETGAPYIARMLEAKLISDNRDTAVAPKNEGESVVVIECFATIALSTNDKGTVTIYELLDSANQSRVRWDNYKPL